MYGHQLLKYKKKRLLKREAKLLKSNQVDSFYQNIKINYFTLTPSLSVVAQSYAEM